MSSRDLVVAAAGASAPSDPNFKNVSLLLSGDGTNGAQNNTFLDSSSNNFTITRNGNTTQGTFSPYGSLWSNYFDGSGDYLSTPSTSELTFGTGNFTVEAWVNWSRFNNVPSSEPGVLQTSTTAGGLATSYTTGVTLLVTGGVYAVVCASAIGGALITTYAPKIGEWHHVAIVRNSGTLTCYVNGVSVGSQSNSNNVTATYAVIGGYYSTTYLMNGYVSNFRAVKGTAVYTSNFTPSTTPLTAVSGTSLLTCQSNRFIDNSSNNFTLTVNGNTSVQRFSPFNPTAPYSAATIGGSGYFDGTGDYLVPSSTSPSNFGSGAFTVDFWVYFNSLSTVQCCLSNYQNAASGWSIQAAASGTVFNVNLSGDGIDISSTTTITVGQWYHVALSGTPGATGIKLFVNGVQEGSTYTGAVSLNSTSAAYIGQLGSAQGNLFTGYMADVRLVKGTALYTSNFTPPTAPLTAITNTSLLCNFTNAGIPDAAMMNDLETVGNAQVSTSVKKYGTGSLAFDGTGDYLYSVATPNTTLSGDFTIECWAYLSSTYSAYPALLTLGDSGSSGTGIEIQIWGSGAVVYVNGVIAGSSTGMTNATNTWIHWAVVRSGTSIKIYKNGTSFGATGTNSTAFTGALRVGVEYYNSGLGNYWYGYIDDLRITKGYARYTANFTPPAQALPTQ